MPRCSVVFACVLTLPLGAAFAGEWRITPAVSVHETYSDNITLASDTSAEEEDYVSEVRPSIEVQGRGRRLDLAGRYSLQNLYYSKDASRNQTTNQLRFDAQSELLEDWFFLDLGAGIDQRFTSNAKANASDGLTPNSGRDDVVTTSVSPSVRHSFARSVELDATVVHQETHYENPSIRDVEIEKGAVSLAKGAGFNRFSWAFNHLLDKEYAEDVLRSERKATEGSVYYRLLERVSIVVNGGKEEGRLVGTDSFRDGSYWSAGLLWEPTPRFSIKLSSGDEDKQATFNWAPTSRTLLNASYVNRDVGLRPGTEWRIGFNHKTRRTSWQLSHSESITSDAKIDQIVDEIEQVLVDANNNGLTMSSLSQLSALGNEAFRRQYSLGGFSIESQKNSVGIMLSRDQRDYLLSSRLSDSHIGTLNWTHYFSKRTYSYINYFLETKKDTRVPDQETAQLAVGLTRGIGRRSSAGAEYRHATYDEQNVNKDYEENRVSVNFKITL